MSKNDNKKKEEKRWVENYFKDKNNCKEGCDVFDLPETEQEHRLPLMKRIICKDGFTMSVQAGRGMYCDPRVTAFFTNSFIYSELEIGFPSRKEELLMEYAEDRNKPKDTVYPYVPVGVIDKVIEKHKGIKP